MAYDFSRRSFLWVGASAAVLAAKAPAEARAPRVGRQAPYFHRFNMGDAEVTVVSDGVLPLGDPSGTFLGASKEEIQAMLRNSFLAPDNIVLEQNVPIVNMGSKLVLFDTGMGASKLFGPQTGRLLRSMQEAGIRPRDIDATVCSHAHIDHIGGIVDARGRVLFPNAQVYLSQVDFDFWTDEAKLNTPLKDFVAHARRNLLPVRNRIQFFRDGQEFLPGITAISAPGHTVGHTIFNVASAGKSFAFLADLTHHQVLLLEKPRLEFSYDSDPKQAAETRVKHLESLAANRTLVMAYHFPWPGLGHLAKAGEGYRYYPEPMRMTL